MSADYAVAFCYVPEIYRFLHIGVMVGFAEYAPVVVMLLAGDMTAVEAVVKP